MNTPYVFLNGDVLPAHEARVSVADHGFLYGDGIYETLRTVHGRVFDAESHFRRLEHSAKSMKLGIPFSFSEILSSTEDLVKKNAQSSAQEFRIRWTLTRGENGFLFSGCCEPTFLITAVELVSYPSEYCERGVGVTTIDLVRILPEIKSTSLLAMVAGKQKCGEVGAFECLFLENGLIREGTVGNFFVYRENEVWTAPRGKVLAGTAAKRVVKKLSGHGVEVRERDFGVDDVVGSDGAFLTNSVYGVMPVTSIEGKRIGYGVVGRLVGDVMENFWE